MSQHLFITGATGFLGGEVARRLLTRSDETLHILLRARDETHFEARKKGMADALAHADRPTSRLKFVWGDITRPRFGLSEIEFESTFEMISGVIHTAASTRFDLTKAEATEQNINGGRHIVDLACWLQERGRLDRLDYVSTCYVGGDRRGRFYESEANVGQQFRNTYEWSKCIGEVYLREAMGRGLRASIHRPSIIVGDSQSGAAATFTALYMPIKVYARGWWRTLPGRPDTLLDLIPVDYVAEAMLRLRKQEETLGHCFHLAAGDDAIKIEDVVSRLNRYIDAPPVRYVDPDRWQRYVHPLAVPFLNLTRNGRKVRNVIEAFLPYFSGNPLFDTAERDRFLPDYRPPSALDYFDKIMRYAVESDFRE